MRFGAPGHCACPTSRDAAPSHRHRRDRCRDLRGRACRIPHRSTLRRCQARRSATGRSAHSPLSHGYFGGTPQLDHRQPQIRGRVGGPRNSSQSDKSASSPGITEWQSSRHARSRTDGQGSGGIGWSRQVAHPAGSLTPPTFFSIGAMITASGPSSTGSNDAFR